MGRALRFTLAEDDAKYLYLLHRAVLAAYPGSSISAFSNAEDALAHIMAVGTDILITDHGMGIISGTQLIRELRDRGLSVPIIMVSGSDEARGEAISAGANEFLHKDVALHEIVPMLKKLLQM